ncbi:hypothetical protein M378DRAFT_19336 [Amanita muscaria Koide BX008]|uniref:Uncharacterized protein n=1 Tax=Amanita muscaria (strain Koide BX008) TaxID=946122 RepID=A0A0C2VYP7_AMAMK|nr:hypothetical protein M378DRAFT_19336 [Amanita muscaria Koide BX008]
MEEYLLYSLVTASGRRTTLRQSEMLGKPEPPSSAIAPFDAHSSFSGGSLAKSRGDIPVLACERDDES